LPRPAARRRRPMRPHRGRPRPHDRIAFDVPNGPPPGLMIIGSPHVKFSRLRLVGFKSFVEPTELPIEPGMTGIVGPNGCGKSNLLEALRWVMGENSAKSMRGSGMDDVVFAGTNYRPSRNTAEVSLVVDNTKRDAPASYNDDEAVEITRRIEREMGSIYKIN